MIKNLWKATAWKDIKLRKKQKTGNYQNICIYFDKGLQEFKNFKKENHKFEA